MGIPQFLHGHIVEELVAFVIKISPARNPDIGVTYTPIEDGLVSLKRKQLRETIRISVKFSHYAEIVRFFK